VDLAGGAVVGLAAGVSEEAEGSVDSVVEVEVSAAGERAEVGEIGNAI